MTKPKELKVGDRVRVVLNDGEHGHEVGDHGEVVGFHDKEGWIDVAVGNYTQWLERSELRKLPDRKEGA